VILCTKQEEIHGEKFMEIINGSHYDIVLKGKKKWQKEYI
jgi:hypothetical protein